MPRHVSSSAKRLHPADPATPPANLPALPASPRWKVTLTPQPAGNVQIQIEVFASDVSAGEVGHGLVLSAAQLTRNPVGRLPTVLEVEEQKRVAAVQKEHPATHLLVRDDDSLWLGDVAYETHGHKLAAVGWKAMSCPPDVKRACEYALDPQAFSASYLG